MIEVLLLVAALGAAAYGIERRRRTRDLVAEAPAPYAPTTPSAAGTASEYLSSADFSLPAEAAPAPRRAPFPVGLSQLRSLARLAIPMLLAFAFIGFAGNQLRFWAVLALVAAMALYVTALVDIPWGTYRQSLIAWPASWSGPSSTGLQLNIRWDIAALVVIMAIAVFFRYSQLDQIPLEMTSDHAEKYLDIQRIQSGERPIFFPANSGREGTEFYIASVLASLTGFTYLTLKLIMATVSLLEIPVMFVLGRTVFGPLAGILAAVLLAVSKWDIGIAREAFRASFAPFWSAVCLLCLYRALKEPTRGRFLLLGGAMGVGLYGYTSFRVVLLFVAFSIGAFILFDPRLRGIRRQTAANAALAYGLTAMIALPVIRYAVDFPNEFLFRTITRTTEAESSIAGGAIGAFAVNVMNMLLMFNVQGDRSWVQNVPGEPQLDPVTGGLFLVGAGYALYRTIRYRDVLFGTLLAGIVILTLPSTLALAFPIENPHVNRAAPVIPVVFLLAAVPAAMAVRSFGSRTVPPGVRLLGVIAIIGLTVAAAQSNYHSYFQTYGDVHRRNTPNHREIAAVFSDFVRNGGSSQNAHIVSFPFWLDHRVVALEMGDFAWRNTALLDRAEDAARVPSVPGPKLFILNRDDTRSAQVLSDLFPLGLLRDHASQVPGRDFRSFYVPG